MLRVETKVKVRLDKISTTAFFDDWRFIIFSCFLVVDVLGKFVQRVVLGHVKAERVHQGDMAGGARVDSRGELRFPG